MATPVSIAPTLDPRVIQTYRFVAVSTTGVRTPLDPGPASHHTLAEAQTKAAALASVVANTSYVEIWPPAPPCFNGNAQVT